jgi:hypothetical protein
MKERVRFRTELTEEQLARGFDDSTDIFKRKDLALRLTGLFESMQHGSVALLDGRWGTGKSTFVKLWAAELKKRDIPSIYFDAFASDYIESPFQAVAGAFVTAAVQARRDGQPAYRTFLSRAAAVGKTIASMSAKVGVKAVTLGAVNAADLGELGKLSDALVDGAADITEEGVKRLLEEHATRETQFASLRESLQTLPSLLRPSGENGDTVPLIVFIDELDRCRPDFSLGILETLKHFFRADALHFVLVTNRDYLELSVGHRYGVSVGASEYLEKFYDFVVFFEQSYVRHDPASVASFVNAAAQGVLPRENQSYNDVRDYIKQFSIAYRLSLRQIQALTTNIAISYLAYSERELRPDFLVCFLAVLKIMRPALYRKAKAGLLTWEDSEKFLQEGFWEGQDGDRIFKVLRFHLDSTIKVNDPEWHGWGESLWRYNIEHHRVIPYLANSILDRFGAPTERSPIAPTANGDSPTAT